MLAWAEKEGSVREDGVFEIALDRWLDGELMYTDFEPTVARPGHRRGQKLLYDMMEVRSWRMEDGGWRMVLRFGVT